FDQNPASDKAKGNLMAMNTKVGESEQFQHKNFDAARQHYEFAAKGWAELTEKMRQFPEGDPNLDEQERLNFRDRASALADANDHVVKIFYAEEDSARRDPAKSLEWLNKTLEIRKKQLAANPNYENRYRLGVSYLYLADLALKRNDINATVAYN